MNDMSNATRGMYDNSGDAFARWIRTMPTLAEAVRRLRALQKLTLQEVADLAGLSKSYVARIESGERMPERDTLIALLLAAYSLPIRDANRVLLLAGYAPIHHLHLAGTPSPRRNDGTS